MKPAGKEDQVKLRKLSRKLQIAAQNRDEDKVRRIMYDMFPLMSLEQLETISQKMKNKYNN